VFDQDRFPLSTLSGDISDPKDILDASNDNKRGKREQALLKVNLCWWGIRFTVMQISFKIEYNMDSTLNLS
jgi:hypothetical protein